MQWLLTSDVRRYHWSRFRASNAGFAPPTGRGARKAGRLANLANLTQGLGLDILRNGFERRRERAKGFQQNICV
jgi:hypothetical protein